MLCVYGIEPRGYRLCSLHNVSVAFYHILLDGMFVWTHQLERKTSMAWSGRSRKHCTRPRAALMFEEDVIQAMVEIGFIAVTVAAQTFYHESWQVLATEHGDDFIADGDVQALSWTIHWVSSSCSRRMSRVFHRRWQND